MYELTAVELAQLTKCLKNLITGSTKNKAWHRFLTSIEPSQQENAKNLLLEISKAFFIHTKNKSINSYLPTHNEILTLLFELMSLELKKHGDIKSFNDVAIPIASDLIFLITYSQRIKKLKHRELREIKTEVLACYNHVKAEEAWQQCLSSEGGLERIQTLMHSFLYELCLNFRINFSVNLFKEKGSGDDLIFNVFNLIRDKIEKNIIHKDNLIYYASQLAQHIFARLSELRVQSSMEHQESLPPAISINASPLIPDDISQNETMSPLKSTSELTYPVGSASFDSPLKREIKNELSDQEKARYYALAKVYQKAMLKPGRLFESPRVEGSKYDNILKAMDNIYEGEHWSLEPSKVKHFLAAWEDENSELFKALNMKRYSFYGYSLTLFSGKNWSDMINGDSAIVKQMKAADIKDEMFFKLTMV